MEMKSKKVFGKMRPSLQGTAPRKRRVEGREDHRVRCLLNDDETSCTRWNTREMISKEAS